MRTVTVRELRQRFPEVEARLKRGETVALRKRRQVIARIVPEQRPPVPYPDFEQIQREIFGDKTASRTFTEMLREERDRY